jgi:hypothetical protein
MCAQNLSPNAQVAKNVRHAGHNSVSMDCEADTDLSAWPKAYLVDSVSMDCEADTDLSAWPKAYHTSVCISS